MTNKLTLKILGIAALIGFALWKVYPLSEKINLGLDLQGGMHLILQVETAGLTSDAASDAPERALEIIRTRIDQFGVSEPQIQLQGDDRILVQLPGVTDRDRALDLIGKTALLEFKIVSSDSELLKDAIAGEIAEGYELRYVNKEPVLLAKEVVVHGDTLVDARVSFDTGGFGEPTVSISFDKDGAKKFAEVTAANVGERLAIVLDGVPISAPRINEPIPSGNAQITGRFTAEEAGDLAIKLRAGALPAPITILEERTVGATLGKDSVEKGIRSILMGGIAVLVFMAVYYFFCGLLANLALVLNLLFVLAALALFKATLTLPGIAGIVLTIGMAVDANVLIFERIREEIKRSKSIRIAIDHGYKRAFKTILDANITTLIIAFILFQFGTGPIKGFAVTLTIGIISSMFTAIVITRLIFNLFTKGRGLKSLTMLQFVREPRINFIGKRRWTYVLSAVVIIWGMWAFAQKGEANYGIDFTGGLLQEFRFKELPSFDNIRKGLKNIGQENAPIQQFGKGNDILIRTDVEDPNMVTEELEKEFGKENFEVLRVEKVGPAIGSDLRKRAILSIIFSLIAIGIYITFRFDIRFAIGAIAALLHDVLVTVGLLSLTGREITLPVVAALLTLVGYSINDTIVVFDRIREDLRSVKKGKLSLIVNGSLNETLSRTIITSLTTLLVVGALFFFGGEVINDFAFVLMVGVIVGTYSSIFIASPIVVDWKRR